MAFRLHINSRSKYYADSKAELIDILASLRADVKYTTVIIWHVNKELQHGFIVAEQLGDARSDENFQLKQRKTLYWLCDLLGTVHDFQTCSFGCDYHRFSETMDKPFKSWKPKRNHANLSCQLSAQCRAPLYTPCFKHNHIRGYLHYLYTRLPLGQLTLCCWNPLCILTNLKSNSSLRFSITSRAVFQAEMREHDELNIGHTLCW